MKKRYLYILLLEGILAVSGCWWKPKPEPPVRIQATSAARFDAEADYLSRTAGLLDYNSAYTVMFWAEIVTDLNNYGHFWAIAASATEVSGDWQNSDWFGTDADGTTVRIGTYSGGSGNVATGTNLSTGTWYHFTARRNSSSSFEVFINGTSGGADASTATNISGRSSVGGDYIGRFNASFEQNMRIEGFMQYNVALSNTEIDAQYNAGCLYPQRLTNLTHYYPFQSDFADDIGTDDYTENGTIAFESGNGSTNLECAGTSTPTTKPKFILPTNWGQIEKIEPRGLIYSEMYARN